MIPRNKCIVCRIRETRIEISTVNFINVKCAHFLYERRFGSFFCVCKYEKFVRKNVDEIDTWSNGKNIESNLIFQSHANL
jgi:hypothetical protein